MNEDTNVNKKSKTWLIIIILLVLIGIGIALYFVLGKEKSPVTSNDVEKDYLKEISKYSVSGEYKYVSKKGNYYVVEESEDLYSDSKTITLFDNDFNELFTQKFDYPIVDYSVLDDAIYIRTADNNGNIVSYKYDKELIKLSEHTIEYNENYPDMYLYFQGIYYYDYIDAINYEDNYKYLGYIIVNIDFDNKLPGEESYMVCMGSNECYESDYSIYGHFRLSMDDDYRINDSQSIIVSKNDCYGIMNLKDGKLLVDCIYDELYSVSDNKFIAIKNGKTGLIDRNGNILIEFNYDFIGQTGPYILAKNGKLGIMDEDFNMITDFVFDYDTENDYYYQLCCGTENMFSLLELDNKYVLNTHADSRMSEYDNLDVYVINKDGSYEVMSNVAQIFKDSPEYVTILNEKDEYEFYNNKLEKIYTIGEDLSFFTLYPVLPNIYRLNEDIYYYYDSGKLVDDINVLQYEYGDYILKFIPDKETLSLYSKSNKDKPLVNDIYITQVQYFNNGSFEIVNSKNVYRVS